ncbi:hypothetical protein [Aliikangiella sp. IMCC44359]|uniref:hypothetical protein n=1 Tax=Aliikangiella sp. IMCC44359 TaxID=3459125 RepID=UPI00403AA1BE
MKNLKALIFTSIVGGLALSLLHIIEENNASMSNIEHWDNATVDEQTINSRDNEAINLKADLLSDNIENTVLSSKEPLVSYVGGKLSIRADSYPLTLLLEKISSLTGLSFVPDKSSQDDLMTIDIKTIQLESALKLLFEKYHYAFFYKNTQLNSIAVYSIDSNESINHKFASKHFNQVYEGENEYSVEPDMAMLQQLNVVNQQEAELLINKGIESTNEKVRAMSLWGAEQKSIFLAPAILSEIVFNDASTLVRSLAFSQLLNNPNISTEVKSEVAFQLSNEKSEVINQQANSFLDGLAQQANNSVNIQTDLSY